MRTRLPIIIAIWLYVGQPLLAEELLGTIKSVKPPNLLVTDQRKKDTVLMLTSNTKVLLPDKKGTVADLKPGYRVRVQYEVKKGVATALEVRVQGISLRIVEIDSKAKSLIVNDKQGKRVALPLDPGATIRLDGQMKKFTDLRPGDRASVVVDDRDTLKLAVHVEAQSGKASLVSADPEETAATPVEEDKFIKLKVFYGTNRNPVDASQPQVKAAVQTGLAPTFLWLAIGAAAVTAVCVLITFYPGWRVFGYIAVSAGTLAVLGFAAWYMNQPEPPPPPDKLARVGLWYGADRGTAAFGVCDVSIPKSHQHAELDGPNLLRGEFKEDPDKHIMLHDVKPLELADFVAQVKAKIKDSSKKDAFVFIHGYNVSFEDAARRTGQLAYDLKFEGAPLFYSWPAQGLFMQYTVDEANAEWAIPHVKEFLKEVSSNTDAKVIHLIAHSMGNRVLTNALKEIAEADGKNGPRFNQIILAAPDIDADTFRTRIYPKIVDSGERLTLYASSRDRALQLSKQVHGYPRLGESDDILILPKLDSIDVTNVDTSIDGHTYYGDNSSVVSDVFYLIQHGLAPAQRSRLREAVRRDSKYWVFVP